MNESSDIADEDAPKADAEGAPPAPRARRRLGGRPGWYWWLRATFLLIAAPVVMLAIAAVLLIGREVTAPSWVVRDVEARAADVLAGGSIGFGEMTVTVGDDLHPRLVVRNAVLRDADGGVLARVPRMEGLISPRGVLQGRVLAQEVFLSGAQVSLIRSSDGAVALAFDDAGTAVDSAPGFLGLLEQVDAVFEQGALEALEQVRADGLIINYVDGRAQRSWVMDDGRIGLDLRGGELELRADVALLSGRDFVTTAEFTYRSPRGSRSAEISAAIRDAAAADIASQTPVLSWLGVLDAPISGAVRGTLDAEGQLEGVSATLQIGQGELQPTAETRPIPFEQARTYLTYNPDRDVLIFDLIEVDSAWGRVAGAARTYLREYEAGWPGALLGQIEFSAMSLNADGFFGAPLVFDAGNVDFRLKLDPFTLDIGQAVMQQGERPVRAEGQVRAAADGWSVALDVDADAIAVDEVLSLWPEEAAPRTRDWVASNVSRALFRDLTFALRARPDEAPVTALSAEFEDATIAYLRDLPPIEGAAGLLSLAERRFAVRLDQGRVVAPEGGPLDLAGSSMVLPETGVPGTPATFDLALRGRVTAAVSVLRQPPFNVLANSDLPVSFVQGRAAIDLDLQTPLGRNTPPEARVWSAVAQLRDLRSEALVPGRVLTAQQMVLRADPESLVVQGRAQLDGVGGDVTFARGLGPGSDGTARLDAAVTIGPAFLQTFNIGLPSGMVSGESVGQLALDLADPTAPGFRLTSDMRGTRLSLAGLGWSKAASAAGALTVVGRLGETPRIDQLSISAPGLQTTGTIRLNPGGGLERAAFERVRLGGWLDAPVVLLGRGAGRPVGVQIAGGALDLRDANFGGEGAGGTSGGTGPIEMALDSLRITDGIRLDNFRGNFTAGSGFQGEFTGSVNGAAPVQGTVVPVRGRSAVRIVSDDAGAVFRAAGLLRNAFGGAMDLTLLPAGGEGSYDGTLTGTDVRVRDAPALASLLDAISVVGLLSQMDGQGLLFTNVDAEFRLTPAQVILTRSSAVGPGLGVSMDGIYASGSQTMDFQGVISPFYALNGIGAILTRPGEGLIGFNFNLRGNVDSPQVIVNPLSALTPGMFREIFRRPPPTVGQ